MPVEHVAVGVDEQHLLRRERGIPVGCELPTLRPSICASVAFRFIGEIWVRLNLIPSFLDQVQR
jgi:hypothetical protein